MDTRPTVSLCMIVRDEAAMLPRFLAAAHGCYDELVVVDTGSRDETVALLTEAGARVLHHPWQDDFSAARNVGLDAAQGEWILVLDADEFPTAGFADELRGALRAPRFGAACIARHDAQRNGVVRHGTPLRVFPNDASVRYRWRIHEEISTPVLRWLEAHERDLVQLTTPVSHIGYLPDRLDDTGKRQRDERILRRALEECPDDLYSAYKLLELYRFWSCPGDARPLAEQTLAQLAAGRAIDPPHIAGDLVNLIGQALHGDAPDRRHAYLLGMARAASHSAHYHLALGQLEEASGQHASAFERFARTLECAPGDPARVLVELRAFMGLVRLALGAGDTSAAVTFAREAQARAPDDPELGVARQILAQAGIRL